LAVDPELDIERSIQQPQKWNRYAYVINNPMKYIDPNGRDEDVGSDGGVVINNSNQVVWIAFDADNQALGSANNLDARIPLYPGETSNTFTSDADAIIIAPGQQIEGEQAGSFKLSGGQYVVTATRGGSLQFSKSWYYKIDRDAGHKLPTLQQWQITPAEARNPQGKAAERQQTKGTRSQRERAIRARKAKQPWYTNKVIRKIRHLFGAA
jgi:hypothetical protein